MNIQTCPSFLDPPIRCSSVTGDSPTHPPNSEASEKGERSVIRFLGTSDIASLCWNRADFLKGAEKYPGSSELRREMKMTMMTTMMVTTMMMIVTLPMTSSRAVDDHKIIRFLVNPLRGPATQQEVLTQLCQELRDRANMALSQPARTPTFQARSFFYDYWRSLYCQ
ncbi:hypothetical protein ACOMHN_022878 [Nucella lapillus]